MTEADFKDAMARLGAYQCFDYGAGWTVWRCGPDNENFAQVNVHTNELNDRTRKVMFDSLAKSVEENGWKRKLS